MNDRYRDVSKAGLLRLRKQYTLGLPLGFGGGAGLFTLASRTDLPLQSSHVPPLMMLSVGVLMLGCVLTHRLIKIKGELNEYL